MLRRFLAHQRGATAVEFALLVGPFLVILLASVELGIKSFIQADLDRVLTEVGTNLSLTASNAENSRDYVSANICAIAGPLIDCSQLDVGATVVTGRLFEYRNQSMAGLWDLGCGGDIVLIELTYPYFDMLLPFAVADIVRDGDIKRYRSRIVLQREPILSGVGLCTG